MIKSVPKCPWKFWKCIGKLLHEWNSAHVILPFILRIFFSSLTAYIQELSKESRNLLASESFFVVGFTWNPDSYSVNKLQSDVFSTSQIFPHSFNIHYYSVALVWATHVAFLWHYRELWKLSEIKRDLTYCTYLQNDNANKERREYK